MLGLYIHVPFCAAICNYCNFNRGLFDAELKARYVDALVTEIERAGRTNHSRIPNHARFPNPERTASPARIPNPESRTPVRGDPFYLGGGPPSLLEPEEIARIIAACETSFDVAAD